MDFKYVVKTTKNTTEPHAVLTDMKLTEGVIRKVQLLHPEGCHGLAYASIWFGGHQLYPSNPEVAYHGNAVPMEFEDNYELKGPAILKLKTWNLDDTYDHSVYVRITVLRPVIDAATQALLDLFNKMLQLLTGRRVS
jgi:hypothetical protein